MKVSTIALAAMLVLAGCVEDPDESSTSGLDGSKGSPPGLYTRLDSIVFSQLDFVYFNRSRSEVSATFSESAKAMLSDDTLLFHRDTVYPYDTTSYVETFVRTEFDPKGWFAFHDAQGFAVCKPDSSGRSEGWFVRIGQGPDFSMSCTLNPLFTPITYTLYAMHHPGKGFAFYTSSSVGNVGLGKARVYYWR